ncbi:MAG: recombinase RecA [Bacteroidota bacterium]
MTQKVDHQKSLQVLLNSLQKKYGEGVIMSLGDLSSRSVPVLSTGCYYLNQALGIGGLPWGRIIEIYGLEASGKTTLALHAIAEAQKAGHRALFIDAEHAFDQAYAAAVGIRIDQLLICQPDYGEQALSITQQVIDSGKVKIVVIDSVSALIPESELKGDMGAPPMGAQARMMSQVMRKLAAIVHKKQALCVFINQVRHKIGVFFGSPETTSGGNALKFYASIRLKVNKGAFIKDSDHKLIGHEMKVKVVKNKMAPPFQEAIIPLHYGEGIAKEAELLIKALVLEVIQQTKSWYSYQGKQLGQGKEKILQLLKQDNEFRRTVVNEVEKQARVREVN